MIDWIRFGISAVLMILGLVVCVIGVIGVFRFRYAANRMHAAAINDTLGVSFCMLAMAISAPDIFTALKLLLVVMFLWISAPVASHLLCRLEIETNEERSEYMDVVEEPLHSGYETVEKTVESSEYILGNVKEEGAAQ